MRKGVTFLTTVVLAGALALPLKAQDTPTADTVVATVNGTDITFGHVIVAYTTLPPQFQQMDPAQLMPAIINQLVQQTALQQSFDGAVSTAARLALENEERSVLAGEAIEGVMASTDVTEEARAIYDERYASGTAGEEYNASHILVETQEEAQAIVEELANGADFAEMAREHSTGPSGPGGGELGWFGAGRMVPDFEAAVIALEVGAVSDPVETQFGWHVIKLNDARSLAAPTFDEVRADIETELRQNVVTAHVDQLIADADVVVPELDIDAAQISNIDLLRD